MKKNDYELMLEEIEYMKELVEAGEENPIFVEAMELVYNDAKSGVKLAQKLLKGWVSFSQLPECQEDFYYNLDVCEDRHAGFKEDLEAIKDKNWGDAVVFGKKYDELKRLYRAEYSDLRASYTQFKKLAVTSLNSHGAVARMCEDTNEDLRKSNRADAEELISEGERFVEEVEANGLGYKKDIDETVAEMEKILAQVRKDMRADFAMGETAVEQILNSERSGSQERGA